MMFWQMTLFCSELKFFNKLGFRKRYVYQDKLKQANIDLSFALDTPISLTLLRFFCSVSFQYLDTEVDCNHITCIRNWTSRVGTAQNLKLSSGDICMQAKVAGLFRLELRLGQT